LLSSDGKNVQVMNREPVLDRNARTGTRCSSTSPSLPPRGTAVAMYASCAASCSGVIEARVFSYIGVQIAGAIALTVMSYRAHSRATVRVQATTAPLLAE